ncbi:MAG: hypothetical protein A2297_04945 [Elusimicrobia bacterium RIFOXYB2_FULL_48_7]|nr:MAG: hypothetical protein A2297_04945 [Elusimicrobia bacterium RIFOXYB2_FULL_48_7]
MSVDSTSNETWAYDFEYLGKRYRKRFKTQKEALRAEALKRSDLSKGLFSDEKITFGEAAQLFFENHSKPNKSSGGDDRAKIKVLTQLFGDKKLVDFTPLDIQNMRNYLQDKGLKVATINRYHGFTKALFNRMTLWRRFTGFNPACGVKLKPEFNAHVRWLSKDEIEKLKPCLHKKLYPYFMGALHTGMRLGELVNLTWENVTLTIRDIFVAKSKSGKSRHIPVNDALYKVLLNLYGVGKNPGDLVFGNLTDDAVAHRFKKACNKVGIKNMRWHDLRHSFASHLGMAGVNIFQISKWLGHASVTTTERYYAHLCPNYKREEMEKLNDLTSCLEGGSSNSRQTFVNLELAGIGNISKLPDVPDDKQEE